MNFLPHRALALLILLLALTTLTGALATVQALAGSGAADACCSSMPAEDQQQPSSPCAAECPCTSCLVLLQPLLVVPPAPLTAGQPASTTLANLHLSTLLSPLDYPPEPA